jgi:3-oxoacyl-[acyl-carrier protein] reductase
MLIPNDPEHLGNNGRLAVLGGCGGIGRELVTAASRRGLRVVVLDLAASLERHPPAENVLGIAVDATDAKSLADAFNTLDAEWGGLDGFVNLCGYMHDNGPLGSLPKATWHDIVDGNLSGTYHAAQAALPLLVKGEGAAMVHASSGLAQYIRPGFGAYAAAKAGVIALTKTLALENAPVVRANAVAPSAVDTAFLRGGTGRSSEDEAPHVDFEAYINAIPIKRIATPPDIVEPILFLLSDASAYMTGQVLWINGGAYMP